MDASSEAKGVLQDSGSRCVFQQWEMQVMLLMLAVSVHAKCAVAAHDSGFRRVLLGEGREDDVHDPKKRKTQLMLMMLAASTYSMKGKCGQCWKCSSFLMLSARCRSVFQEKKTQLLLVWLAAGACSRIAKCS